MTRSPRPPTPHPLPATGPVAARLAVLMPVCAGADRLPPVGCPATEAAAQSAAGARPRRATGQPRAWGVAP